MTGQQKNTKSLPTAIYVRVSTEDQAQEGFSIRAQIEKLKAYALLKDWEIYDIYNDEGISGKNIVDRPSINRMIDDIKLGKVKNVLVFKVDRLTRSTRNLIELVDLFEENKCAFNSLTESIDTDTPSGRMFLKIIGIFAEFERENLASRVTLGFERKAKEGYSLATNNLSYGYTREKGQKIQQIQHDEARIVKEIFEMYIDKNQSMHDIARTLNRRKIKTKKGAMSWDRNTIKGILTNPNYIGKVRYSIGNEDKYFEADGHHEPIISDEIFSLTHEKIVNTPRISRTKKAKDDVYFCGVLVCGMCHHKFSTQRSKSTNGEKQYTTTAYRCSNKQYHNDDIGCKCPDISHKKVENAFIEYIEKINNLSESEIDEKDFENDSVIKERELLENIADYESKISNLSSKKKRLMEQYVREEIAFEEYKELIAVLNEDYDSLEMELNRMKADIPTVNEAPEILKEDIILNIKQNWNALNNTERMIFLQRFVKKIVLKVEKERPNFNTVKIEKVEFNTGLPLEKNYNTKSETSIRNILNAYNENFNDLPNFITNSVKEKTV